MLVRLRWCSAAVAAAAAAASASAPLQRLPSAASSPSASDCSDSGGDGDDEPFHRCSTSLVRASDDDDVDVPPVDEDSEPPDDSSDDSGDDWLMSAAGAAALAAALIQLFMLCVCVISLSFRWAPASVRNFRVACARVQSTLITHAHNQTATHCDYMCLQACWRCSYRRMFNTL